MLWTGRRRLKDIEDRLNEQAALLAELSSQLDELDSLPMEWADWFEKFKNLYARLNKRVSREEAKEAEAEAPAVNPAALSLLNPYKRGA